MPILNNPGVAAPSPGAATPRVTQVTVETGQWAGIEAMKMESTIAAPCAGLRRVADGPTAVEVAT